MLQQRFSFITVKHPFVAAPPFTHCECNHKESLCNKTNHKI